MRETKINNIKFNSKKEVLAHAKEIMARNVDLILFGDDLNFMWELVINNYPNPDAKKLHTADNIIIRESTRYNQKSLWVWVIDYDGEARDVSLYKSVDNLKWDEVSVNNDFIDFGKYKNQIVSDVIDDDVSYFQWLVSEDWVRKSLKDIIYIELNRIDNEKLRKANTEFDIDTDYEPPS